jgi:ubiquinone/menaquinone biosynthesis C-methylase UbiE
VGQDAEQLSATVRYHLAELEVIRAERDARRLVPVPRDADRAVLDIGCGIGQTLLSREIAHVPRRCGIDVDESAIAYGTRQFPELELRVSGAERLPFAAAEFDLVYSRVALPYTDIPVALAEIRRVLRPGGRFWASLHAGRMERIRFRRALASGALKTLVDSGYVWANSLYFNALGRTFARPWSGLRESVQMRGGMRRALLRAGFRNCELTITPTFFVVEAS